jgi:hypothetical protein
LTKTAEQDRSFAELGVTYVTALAGWALVHGLSALLLEGTASPEPGTDVATLARSVTGRLRRRS